MGFRNSLIPYLAIPMLSSATSMESSDHRLKTPFQHLKNRSILSCCLVLIYFVLNVSNAAAIKLSESGCVLLVCVHDSCSSTQAQVLPGRGRAEGRGASAERGPQDRGAGEEAAADSRGGREEEGRRRLS